MPINLHLLRVFHAVAERRSFSRAAGALFVSQPAVSRAVRALEHQLDLSLIERGAARTRGVRLTDAGQALFDHARGIFALERVADDDVRARVGQQRGRLTLGASTTIAGYWLPPYAAEFAHRYPAARLEIRVGNTHAIGQALIDCEIDLALVEGQVQDPRIRATRWRDDELQIIAQAGSALARRRKPTREELNASVWLQREQGSGTREVTDRLMHALRLAPANSVVYASNEGIARATAAGAGLAMLPARVVRELVNVGALCALTPPQIPARALMRPLFLLQLRERPASPLVRGLCTLLAAPLDAF